MTRRKGEIIRSDLQRGWPRQVALRAEKVRGLENGEIVRGAAKALAAHRWQALPTEAIGEGLRVLRVGKAEHHVVAVIAAQEVRQRRRGLCRLNSRRRLEASLHQPAHVESLENLCWISLPRPEPGASGWADLRLCCR